MGTSLQMWLSQNWQIVALFAVMAITAFLLLRVQVFLRDRAAQTIQRLLIENPELCAERLENNRRLKLIFRAPVLALWRLEAYLACGSDEKAQHEIVLLDKMKLEPHDKLEFYQKRLSFFAETGNGGEAKASRDALREFLVEIKAAEIQPYCGILKEADQIIGIYIDHDLKLIDKLIGQAQHEKKPVIRGIARYRTAKLYYYAGNKQKTDEFLHFAKADLKGTYYEEIISQALENHSVLETK